MDPLALVLFQILVILVGSRLVGSLVQRAGQAHVIGEMLAGILLGKTFLGAIWPEAYTTLFPPEAFPHLKILSQIGLIFYMAIIGLELEMQTLKRQAAAVVMISNVGILIPFAFGIALSLLIYNYYAPPNVNFLPFALFIGIAMSITAFPVLARIIQEQRLMNTPLGNISITSAAVGDITAWCLLAVIVGIAQYTDSKDAIQTIALSLVYVLFMIKFVGPWLQSFLESRKQEALVPVFLVTVLISALVTELIGIHALFGAFIAGIVMPNTSSFKEYVSNRVTDLSTIVLLPLFFAYSGLRTEIGLLKTGFDWLMCLLVIVVAIAGKMGGSAIVAKYQGLSWRHSLAIGALMNTRGLMELIVLNIGLDMGILSPKIFTMLVIMAVITTMMTSPLLNLLLRPADRRKA